MFYSLVGNSKSAYTKRNVYRDGGFSQRCTVFGRQLQKEATKSPILYSHYRFTWQLQLQEPFLRIEAALLTGMTKVACTSELAKWNVPKTEQNKHNKNSTAGTASKQQIKLKNKMTFIPISNKLELGFQNAKETREKLYTA